MLRIGIVGAGYIAQAHAAAYARVGRSRAQIVGVADPHLERAQTLAAPHQARAVESVEALLELGVDAVSLCVPTPLHHATALSALRAGKHVLCEKPIARSMAQADEMLTTAAAAGVKFMVGHISRYEADQRKARDLLRGGDLGPLRMAYHSICGSLPEWSVGGWLTDSQQSGGPVLDLAIHSIDYLLWLFDQPVVRVFAVGAEGKPNLQTYANVMIRFADGGMALVESSWAYPASQPMAVRAELITTRARLEWNYEDLASMTFVRDDVPQAGRRLALVGEDPFVAEIDDFLACIEQDTAPPVSGAEAARALRVALAAIDSAAFGRVMHVDDPGATPSHRRHHS